MFVAVFILHLTEVLTATKTCRIWNVFHHEVITLYFCRQLYGSYTKWSRCSSAPLPLQLHSHVAPKTRWLPLNLLPYGTLSATKNQEEVFFKIIQLECFVTEAYRMVVSRKKKSISCLLSINYTKHMLFCTTAVQHQYVRGCSCTSLHCYVGIYRNS